jgi:hypothetical protein
MDARSSGGGADRSSAPLSGASRRRRGRGVADVRQQAPRSLTARNALEWGVLGEINTLRRQHVLAPLRLNVRLRAAADALALLVGRRARLASRPFTSIQRRVCNGGNAVTILTADFGVRH